MAEARVSSPPPLTPPQSEEDRLNWLRLLRSRRVGVTTFFRLMQEHGSAKDALAVLPEIAREAGVEGYETCPPDTAEAEMRSARSAGAVMLCWGETGYPARLTEIPDPPPVLWVKGDKTHLTNRMIALVGARNASSLGTRMAKRLAADLSAAGFTVVSGLARGVDTAAHFGALQSGTIAVQAGGVDVIYPVENTRLGEDIAKSGLRLSEQPIGLTPQARHFPPRNRIISGLSEAVIVVEAAAKSGSLITARNALDQGREILAVPGHPFDARASGCNMLIRDGAMLVRGLDDVLEALAPLAPVAENPADEPPLIPKAPDERRTLTETATLHSMILARLGPSPVAEDQLIRDLDEPAGRITPEIVTLELEGKITRQSGGLLSLAS